MIFARQDFSKDYIRYCLKESYSFCSLKIMCYTFIYHVLYIRCWYITSKENYTFWAAERHHFTCSIPAFFIEGLPARNTLPGWGCEFELGVTFNPSRGRGNRAARCKGRPSNAKPGAAAGPRSAGAILSHLLPCTNSTFHDLFHSSATTSDLQKIMHTLKARLIVTLLT